MVNGRCAANTPSSHGWRGNTADVRMPLAIRGIATPSVGIDPSVCISVSLSTNENDPGEVECAP
jgi:hypothetical protein